MIVKVQINLPFRRAFQEVEAISDMVPKSGDNLIPERLREKVSDNLQQGQFTLIIPLCSLCDNDI